MGAATNGHVPPASAAARQSTVTRSTAARGSRPPRAAPPRRPTPARASLDELQRLVRTLEHHVAVDDIDTDRDVEVLGDTAAVTHVEDRLRAVTALLVNLSTYQRMRARVAPATTAVPAEPTADTEAVSPTQVSVTVNGVTVANGTPSRTHDLPLALSDVGSDDLPLALSEVGSDRELAAATARYIARDLAARQLSEFTSAEGYRLARSLARLGGVERPVERLLVQANRMRLHPAPLADAVSHSQR